MIATIRTTETANLDVADHTAKTTPGPGNATTDTAPPSIDGDRGRPRESAKAAYHDPPTANTETVRRIRNTGADTMTRRSRHHGGAAAKTQTTGHKLHGLAGAQNEGGPGHTHIRALAQKEALGRPSLIRWTSLSVLGWRPTAPGQTRTASVYAAAALSRQQP